MSDQDKINGKHYCRCDTPDSKGRRSECGLPDVQCTECRLKDEIEKRSILFNGHFEMKKDFKDTLDMLDKMKDAVNELNYRLSKTDQPQGFVGWVDRAKYLLDKFNDVRNNTYLS